jgi:hypothetical protein
MYVLYILYVCAYMHVSRLCQVGWPEKVCTCTFVCIRMCVFVYICMSHVCVCIWVAEKKYTWLCVFICVKIHMGWP